MKTELLTLSQTQLDRGLSEVSLSSLAPRSGDTVATLLAKLLKLQTNGIEDGLTPPAHMHEDIGAIWQFRYDEATQTRWQRVPDLESTQMSTIDFGDFLTASVLNEHVLLFNATSHTWTLQNLLTEGYTADGETFAVDVHFKDPAAGTIDSATATTEIVTALEGLLPAHTITLVPTYGVWTLDLTGMIDGDGLAVEDLDVYQDGPTAYAVIDVGDDVVAELEDLLPGYTLSRATNTLTITQAAGALADVALPLLMQPSGDSFAGIGTVAGATMSDSVTQTVAAELDVTITGAAGSFPVSGSTWFKTLIDQSAALDAIDLTEFASIGTLSSGENIATEIPATCGTVNGAATLAIETDTDVWGFRQAVSGGVPDVYPLVGSDEIRLAVGNTSKANAQPSAMVWPLPQWVSDAVANIP